MCLQKAFQLKLAAPKKIFTHTICVALSEPFTPAPSVNRSAQNCIYIRDVIKWKDVERLFGAVVEKETNKLKFLHVICI